MKTVYLTLLGASISLVSFAQEDSLKARQLEDVMVTATRTERKLSNVAVPASIIPGKVVRQTGSLRLQDILQEETGIIVVNSNLGTSLNGYPNPFGQGVQMLGLDPAYTLILLDGEPLVGRNAGILKLDRLATGNIRQVEIVKGPSSSLYGSEAMAGVINIITASPQQEQVDLQLHGASHNTWAGTATYTNRFKKTGVQFFLNRYSSSGYDLDRSIYGQTIDPYRNWNGQLKFTHDFSEKLQWIVSLRDYDSKQSNNYQISWQNSPAIVKGHTNEKDQSAFTQLRWQWKPGYKIFFRTFYDGYSNRSYVNLEKTGLLFDETTFDQSVIKPEIQFERNKSGRSPFIAGSGSYFESIKATRYDGKKNLSTLYAFTQKEWWLPRQKLTVITGGRLDKRSNVPVRLSPKAAIAWMPNDHWKLTLSSGSGFKAPDFRHLYLNFFNSQVGYSILGNQVLGPGLLLMQQQGQLPPGTDITPFANVAELKPEISYGSHAGVHYSNNQWRLEAGLFRNDIRNLIEVFALPFARTNGQSIFSYHNLGRVYTQGVEVNLSYKLSPVMIISGGYQFLDAKDKEVIRQIKEGTLYKRDPVTFQTTKVKRSDYFGLFNRSRHTANIKVSYDDTGNGWNSYVRLIYRGQFGYSDVNGDNIADDPAEMVKGHLLVNAVVGKSLNKQFQLQVGIENIFDYTNAQKMPNIPGRIFFVNANYSFGKIFKNNKTNKI